MADAPVLGAAKKVKLDESAFGASFSGPLVHQSVRAEQAARRRGTAATKTRGMVSGGGAKPWRQKGTGRARAGSNRSPIWTGGGTVFGPQPRSYTFKVNRKEQRAAFRAALSLHAQRESIAILDASAFTAPKTSQALDLLEDWGQPRPDARGPRARGASRRAFVPQPRTRRRAHRRERRRRQSCSPPRRSSYPSRRSRPCRPAPDRRAQGRARTDGAHTGDHPARRLREDLRALGGRPLHVQGPRRTRTRRRSARRSRSSSTSTSSACAR